MKLEYKSILKMYITGYPSMSTGELANFVKENSEDLEHLSVSSLRVYIGIVKSGIEADKAKSAELEKNSWEAFLDSDIEKSIKEDEAKVSEVCDENLQEPLGNHKMMSVEEMATNLLEDILSKFEKEADDIEMLLVEVRKTDAVRISEDAMSGLYKRFTSPMAEMPDVPFIMDLASDEASEFMNEAWAYGYSVEEVATSVTPTRTVDITYCPDSEMLKTEIAVLICMHVGIDPDDESMKSLMSGLGTCNEESPMSLTFADSSEAKEFYYAVAEYGIEPSYSEDHAETEVEEPSFEDVCSSESVTFNPFDTSEDNYTSSGPDQIEMDFEEDEFEDSELPDHIDLVVVGQRDEAYVSGYYNTVNALDYHCEHSVIVYGDEITTTHFDNGDGCIEGSNSFASLPKLSRLYDGISSAIAQGMRLQKDDSTPLSLTIITEDGFDFGSEYTDAETIREIMGKVINGLNWEVTLLSRDRSAEIGKRLGISNTMDYGYTYNLDRELSCVIDDKKDRLMFD